RANAKLKVTSAIVPQPMALRMAFLPVGEGLSLMAKPPGIPSRRAFVAIWDCSSITWAAAPRGRIDMMFPSDNAVGYNISGLDAGCKKGRLNGAAFLFNGLFKPRG